VDNWKYYEQKSLNKVRRQRDLLRVTHENQAILKRISSKEPIYNHHVWEDEWRVSCTGNTLQLFEWKSWIRIIQLHSLASLRRWPVALEKCVLNLHVCLNFVTTSHQYCFIYRLRRGIIISCAWSHLGVYPELLDVAENSNGSRPW